MTTAGSARPSYLDPRRDKGERDFVHIDRPAFWLYAILITVAVAILADPLVTTLRETTAVLWVAAVWLVWGAAVYWLVGRVDIYRSVPVGVRLAAVGWGALCLMFSGRLVEPIGQWLAAVPGDWGAAIPEEAMKFLGVVLIAMIVPAVFARPLGALMCGLLSGLGFTIMENWFQSNGLLLEGSRDLGFAMLMKGTFGAWAHLLFTGLASLAIWYVVARTDRSLFGRLLVAAGFFVLALVLHAFLNIAGGLGAGVFIGSWAASLVILAAVIWWARRNESRWFTTLAQDGGLALSSETTGQLATRRGQRRARRQGQSRRLQHLQLAYVNAAGDRDTSTIRRLEPRLEP